MHSLDKWAQKRRESEEQVSCLSFQAVITQAARLNMLNSALHL